MLAQKHERAAAAGDAGLTKPTKPGYHKQNPMNREAL
jgi:hypothetical protein